MKKLALVFILVFLIGTMLTACETNNDTTDAPFTSGDTSSDTSIDTSDDTSTVAPQNSISKEMAYNGVNNYCHSAYDWSIAENNPDIMYVKSGEETESEYQVIFRSYTGSLVYFYVDKTSGVTRLIEYVPNLNIQEEAGTINLYDYLNSNEK